MKRLECSHGGNGQISATAIEREVFHLLHVLPQDGQGQIVALLTSSDDDAAENQRQRQIEVLEGRTARLGDRYEFSEITRDQYTARLAEIDEQIEKVNAQAASKPAPDPVFHKLREALLEDFASGLAWDEARRDDRDRSSSTFMLPQLLVSA